MKPRSNRPIPPSEPQPVDPRTLALLRCPSCRGPLERRPGYLVCTAERYRYPVVDGVPWLHPEAREEAGG